MLFIYKKISQFIIYLFVYYFWDFIRMLCNIKQKTKYKFIGEIIFIQKYFLVWNKCILNYLYREEYRSRYKQ
jgi:hypothetical protein